MFTWVQLIAWNHSTEEIFVNNLNVETIDAMIADWDGCEGILTMDLLWVSIDIYGSNDSIEWNDSNDSNDSNDVPYLQIIWQ